MKTTLAIVLALVAGFTAHAQISYSGPPASKPVTEAQYDAAIAALPALPAGKAAADVASVSLFGLQGSMRFTSVDGVTLTQAFVVTTQQQAAFYAALPALPTGETSDDIRSCFLSRVGNTIKGTVNLKS